MFKTEMVVRLTSLVGLSLSLFVTSGLAQQQPPPLDPETQLKILKGYQNAPVPLNLVGRDATLVGLGSYLVNVTGDCNGCHSAGPETEYLPGGNPYMGQPVKVNLATYLGGGRDFGAFPDPAGPFPHIVSRNLTPDSTGMAEGGHTLAEFMQIMKTGSDLDHVHPTCAGAPNGKCLPTPFKGDLLQIMPWPAYSKMSDTDLRAIYEYLSAVPCLEGGPGEPANRCAPGVQTLASASPKSLTVTSRQFTLDGTKSTSADGGPLTYAWSIPQGSPSAAILNGNTATPTVQIGQGRQVYTFTLTVTDSAGKTSTDLATVNYQGN